MVLHSSTAQCILFEYFLSLLKLIFENCYQAERKIGRAISMPFLFFIPGPDISDIHISHRRFFLIEEEISITKWYQYLVPRHFSQVLTLFFVEFHWLDLAWVFLG